MNSTAFPSPDNTSPSLTKRGGELGLRHGLYGLTMSITF